MQARTTVQDVGAKPVSLSARQLEIYPRRMFINRSYNSARLSLRFVHLKFAGHVGRHFIALKSYNFNWNFNDIYTETTQLLLSPWCFQTKFPTAPLYKARNLLF